MPRGHFDEAYYRRFYGDRATRVTSQQAITATARFVAGYLGYLGVEVGQVLDVGCGLGLWRGPVRRFFRGARYVGLEHSEYLCGRFGWERGSVIDHAGPPADLVICQGVLQYVPDRDLGRAIENLARLSAGALWLEALTREDWDEHADRSVTDGDVFLRPAARYRRALAKAGLRAAGGGLFLPADSHAVLYELERGHP